MFALAVRRENRMKIVSDEVSMTMAFRVSGRIPDLDNLVKAISDALNGVWYDDDLQVREIHAQRIMVKKGKELAEIKMEVFG